MRNNTKVQPRTPVLVGVGQFKQKPENPVEALEPLAMMAEVLEIAAADAGVPSLLQRATHIWVVKGGWPYPNPGELLAERFGAPQCVAGISPDGGNAPQTLVNWACQAISNNETDVVLIVGAEGVWSRRRARRSNQRIPYTEQTDASPPESLGPDVTMNNEVETERGVQMPVNVYPLFESAFRHRRGETLAQHRTRVAELWQKFNQTAVDNPHAWLRRSMTAEQIRDATPENRMVNFPYTKAMNSNWDVDLAAALILCSAETAEAAGVSRYQWVFPLTGTASTDTAFISNRSSLHSSPPIRVTGPRAMSLAGVDQDDIAHVDIYSCFPSAVQIAATELGFGLERSLTKTGGLPFAGGPLSNYVSHSIAAMADVLRADPGSIGVCSATGGYLTKHAYGVYSTEPPTGGEFAFENCQAEVDRYPEVELDVNYVGPATLEAYTVMHGADGPEVALAAVRVGADSAAVVGAEVPDPADTGSASPNSASASSSPARQWASSKDPAVMAALMESEHIGKTVEVTPEFEFELV